MLWVVSLNTMPGATHTVGGWPLFAGAASLPPDERKGAVLMVTYSELFMFCDLVIGIISLVILITKKK